MGKETGIAKQVMEAPGYRLVSEARTTSKFTIKLPIKRYSGEREVVKAMPTSARNLYVTPSVNWEDLGTYAVTHASGHRCRAGFETIRGAEVAASVLANLFPEMTHRKKLSIGHFAEEVKTMPEEIKNWIRGVRA